jgi:hypothetical protein
MKDQENEQGPPTLPVTPEHKAVMDLLEKIKSESSPILFGTYESRVVFTDGRFVELADSLPPAIDRLRYVSASRLSADTIKKVLPAKPDANAEKVHTESRRGGKYHLSSETHTCVIHAVYYDYLKMRYPQADVFCRGPKKPITFSQDGFLRAVVMPIKG